MGNVIFWPDGFQDAVSDDPFIQGDNIYHRASTTNTYFVSSVTGDDSNGGSATDPYATLVQALTVAGAGDVIVILSGHTETITATQTISARLYIFGVGQGDSRPTFTGNVDSNGDLFTLTAEAKMRGIRILESAQSTTGNAVDASAAGAIGASLDYCEFVCGENDQGIKVLMNSSASFVTNCAFTSSATAHSERPEQALSASRLVRNTTFTGGTYGWKTASTFCFGWGNTASGPVGLASGGTTCVIQCELSDGAYFDTSAVARYHFYMDGLGMTGHPLISGAGLYVQGNAAKVQYVDNSQAQSSDAFTHGLSRSQPYDTVAYAVNTAGAAGLLVVGAGHDETFTAMIDIDDGVIIVGEGTGASRARLTRNYNGVGVHMDSAEGVGLCNLRFGSSGTSTASALVEPVEVGSFVDECDFLPGENDQGPCIFVNRDSGAGTFADDFLISGCTFTASSADASVLPKSSIEGSTLINDNLIIENCTWDGGAYGWDESKCVTLQMDGLTAWGLTLLRDSLFVIESDSYAASLDALVQISTATGTSGLWSLAN